MSAEQVRATMRDYVTVLLERGDFGRFFAEEVEVSVVGTDQRAAGPEAAEQLIRFMHEVAFDAEPEFGTVVCDTSGAAAEAVFIGTHTGEFAGIPASGNRVRVPYSAFYDVAGDKITAVRLYMSLDELVRQIGEPAATTAA
jgi:predicted ester cyclase